MLHQTLAAELARLHQADLLEESKRAALAAAARDARQGPSSARLALAGRIRRTGLVAAAAALVALVVAVRPPSGI